MDVASCHGVTGVECFLDILIPEDDTSTLRRNVRPQAPTDAEPQIAKFNYPCARQSGKGRSGGAASFTVNFDSRWMICLFHIPDPVSPVTYWNEG
jgi:hypothetical protein